MQAEREALGGDARDREPFWVPDSAADELDGTELLRPNLQALKDRSWDLALTARKRLTPRRARLSAADLVHYRNLGLYALFSRYEDDFFLLCQRQEQRPCRVAFYQRFEADYDQLFAVDDIAWLDAGGGDTAFALLFQLRRAFHYIFRYLLGSSEVSALLARSGRSFSRSIWRRCRWR